MEYPLTEEIGNPDLLTGRKKDFGLLEQWLARIPKRLGKSRVILARKKSGKTAIVQRIFNRLWTENGIIMPFYFSIAEARIWYPEFAVEYYQAFASQYISFLERDKRIVKDHLSLEKIREYGLKKSLDILVSDVDSLADYKANGFYGLMWKTAYTAPERFASFYDQRILVILDEFQNITQYIYPDKERRTEPDETMAGSFHNVVSSKIAPMLVTGSYVGWLIMVIDKYLEGGRLKRHFMTPYLTPEEGLHAVYKYAEIHDAEISNESAEMINRLCMSDPFFISCVILSEYEDKDLTTPEGVVNTVNYEITDKSSEMSMTWGEYIELTLKKVNDRYAKAMLLHLSKHADREWTYKELKEELGLDIEDKEIREKLEIMAKADVIETGSSDIDYRGLSDGTLNLILRTRFEKEINEFVPDLKVNFTEQLEELKKDKKTLQGRLNNLTGQFAEFQLFTEFRTRKSFTLTEYFEGAGYKKKLKISRVSMREKFQIKRGKEIETDVCAYSECGRVILTEVKKTQKKTGMPQIKKFCEKIDLFRKAYPKKKVLPAFFSSGGFTPGAMELCREKGIGTAQRIAFFQNE